MTHPRYTACDGDDGPTEDCECHTLFGLRPDAVTHHLDADQKDALLDHIVAREMALTELMVRTLALSLGIAFTDEQTRTVVMALHGDDQRFDGQHDTSVAQLAPHAVLDQVRLFGDLTG
jgi:hypothetical protein